jgi:hypothetical protein
MSILKQCRMCGNELTDEACVVTSDTGDLLLLCTRCEPLVKQIEGVKCDFCSSKNVCVMYMCTDIPAEFCSDDLEGIRAISSGNWAACNECENVIDRKDLNGLVNRCISVLVKYDRHMSKDEKKIAENGIREIYKMFLERYSGKEKIK